jgi:hypothetical protein
VFEYQQLVQPYPGVLRFELNSENVEVADYEQFERALRDFTGSGTMKDTLAALLAQANA